MMLNRDDPFFIRAVNERCKVIIEEYLPEVQGWVKRVLDALPNGSAGFIDFSSIRARMEYGGWITADIDNYLKYQEWVRLDRNSPEYHDTLIKAVENLEMALWAFTRLEKHNTVDQRRTNEIIVNCNQKIKIYKNED